MASLIRGRPMFCLDNPASAGESEQAALPSRSADNINMPQIPRRDFVKRTALTAAALPMAASLLASGARAQTTAAPAPARGPSMGPDRAALRWLEGRPAVSPGSTVGIAWPRGAYAPDTPFAVRTAEGSDVPVQSWPIGYWPDGSLKWSAHAIAAESGLSERLTLAAGVQPAAPARPLRVSEGPEFFEVDTGAIRCRVAKRGQWLINSIHRGEREVARQGRLVALRRSAPEGSSPEEAFVSEIQRVTLEQDGPVRAVLKLEGRHRSASGRQWLPFVVRLYWYAGGEAVRMMHTFIFDGDEQQDFISGLGVRFEVPLSDPLHDRHVRYAGEGSGLWAEAVRGLTGLRRDPGNQARTAQVAGLATPPVDSFPANVRSRLELIPAFGDSSLSQLSADGFQIRKRTKAGHGWVPAGAGRRAGGLGYIGGPSGGLAFGLRDFWQKHPTQLDIRNADTEAAEVTVWLYSPEAPPMDLRFYHDGLGMDTHPEQLSGMEITYEDYEPGFGTPVGIARTSELYFWAVAATPSRQRLVEMAEAVGRPPQLACYPDHLLAAGVFGNWSLPDRSTPAKQQIENQLDYLIALYQEQIDTQRWYGFWDHGDVMHTYDPDRNVWRYDVGGFAWANSELSPDLWLWYAYLRSGRADIFRMAEAMTRHTGEVDSYHLGRFKGLGTRHNVQHWGCSAKQVRISTAAYRRIFYFLTADERVGDNMRDLVDSDQAFMALDPIRKIRRGPPVTFNPRELSVGFGTDWGSLAAAWLAEWERTGNPQVKEKLLNGMRTIGAMPHGFLTSGATYDIETGRFSLRPGGGGISVSHLSAVFGLVEICSELIALAEVPEFERAWLQYCELYNATAEEQRAATGSAFGSLNLGEAHSRLTAYAAHRKGDSRLAQRAINEFYGGAAGLGVRRSLDPQRLEGPDVLNPMRMDPAVSTNAASQWGLAAIQVLALVGERLPERTPAR
jgi:hypothetical protein